MSARDYYTILKVARTATNMEIKAAYRKIALAVHPDVSKKGDMEAAEQFKDASEAYSVLSDAEQRRIYDRTLGVRKTYSSPERWKEAAKKTRAARPLYTKPTPAGFSAMDEDVWKAWHYGIDAIAKPTITQAAGGWFDMENSREQEYFRRMRAKEDHGLGVGRGHRYNTNREKRRVVVGVRQRREERLRREKEERMQTAAGVTQEAAPSSDSGCSIS